MVKKKSGFTLIELLVVIAIIAILAAILFPVFSSARQRSRTASCINNLKQLSQATLHYADDWSGRMPSSYEWCGDTPSRPSGAFWWVYPERGSIYRYVKNGGIFLCPIDKNVVPNNGYIQNIPPGKTAKDFPLSYSMNTDLHCKIVEAMKVKRLSSVMLYIHEKRSDLNDGRFQVTSSKDVPSDVHHDGTCLCYVDGHAKWASYTALRKECQEGYWIAKDP